MPFQSIHPLKGRGLQRVQENTMVKVRSLSSGVGTQRVFGWVSIIWFSTVVGIAGSQDVELQTIPQVVAQCGKNVTLSCDASSSRHMDIQLFSWLANAETVCPQRDGQTDPEVLCERTEESSRHRLTLNLINVMPVNKGKYLCKLRSKLGVKDASTFVTVKDCFERSGSLISESRAVCWFSGVYPSGTVHWFRGNVNLTDTALTQREEDQHGRYNVSSTLYVKKENLNLLYNCSLWIPSDGKYLSSQQFTITHKVIKVIESSGRMFKLQWICIMVELIILRFMT